MDFLIEILMKDHPSYFIRENESVIFGIIPELEQCKGFNQNSVWHDYDVYEHILHVVDGVPNDIVLRLASLFHDLGKPATYTEDENGVGHFYGHWEVSKMIFDEFASKYKLDEKIKNSVSNLILYHDLNMGKIDDDKLKVLINIFGEEDIKRLFMLKRSDLLAQNRQFHYLLDDYEKQEKRMLKK